MPPTLDVYILSKRRDRATIDRFLATYVDRAASDDRMGEELMVLPLDAPADAEIGMHTAEWVPVTSLAGVIAFGLA